MSIPRDDVVQVRASHGLPEPLTPLLGRDTDVAETLRLLDGTRLLTLTGAGGSGKTRLALELAHHAARDGRRAIWAELAPLADGALVPEVLVEALHIRSAGTRDPVDQIIEALCGASALLVLDNCEHLIGGCALLVERILRSCPHVTILATSREPLSVAGEQTWLVPPLANPDAVQLFAARARAVLPVFALEAHNTPAVEIICARLDGIPLAIELAAARVKVLAVWQIAERLNDAFKLLSAGSRTVPRHRTIRETIDWSFRLLSADEQRLFRRLAVFHAGFLLDAAEAVCGGDGLDREYVLQLLSALVDKSLVIADRTAGKARYRLLETVRQFAAEKLEQAGERERLTDTHAHWYFSVAEEAEPSLFGGASEPGTMARIDDDADNIRAVFDWAERTPAGAAIEQRLVYALRWYWFARGHFHECQRRIEHALARTAVVDSAARARALLAAGDSSVWRGDWSALQQFATQSAATLASGGDVRARAISLMHLATAQAFGGSPDSAATFERAIADARADGSRIALAVTLYWAGLRALLRSDTSSARVMLDEALAIGIESGAPPAIGHPATMLGFIALRDRRLDDATAAFCRAFDVFSGIADRWGLTHVVDGAALILLRLDEVDTGTRLLGAASAAWLQLGARPVHHTAFEIERETRIREAMTDERLRIALASGASMPYDDMIALTRAELGRLTAAETPSTAGAAPLIVRALGPLQIVRDGVTLDAAALSLRAREMLVFLLCNRNGCTKEQIGAALWPDADAARLRNNFHVTLHRLRKTLGDGDWVIAHGETYAIAKNVEFDVELFERDVRSPSRLDRAVALYRGDFLANEKAGEWADDVRDRLKNLFARALNAAARTRAAAGDYSTAAAAYQRLVEVEPLDEEAARGLMLALSRAGDTAGASRAYARLCEALRRDLDAEPEPSTQKLHAQISGEGR